jgi:hypothetical protein
MKNLIKYILLLLVISILGSGCKKKLDEVGINPNNPSSVTPNVLLTSSEINVGYVAGGELSRFEGLIDQQLAANANARQFNVFASYGFKTSDFNSSWQNLYLSMFNLKDLADSSKSRGYNEYAGIAMVLEAYTLGLTTDVYGDVPFSKALQGIKNLQPSVDKQADIYKSIQMLLDSGISRLGMAPGNLVPTTDDLVYIGISSQWVKLAYALKARYYLHLKKIDPTAAGSALAAMSNAFTANSDDAYIAFGNGPASAGPWYQFLQQRSGEISFVGGTVGMWMLTNNDPRLAAFIDTTSANYDMLGTAYSGTGSGVQIMTYTEQMFIKAELDASTATSASDYNAAVTASVTAFGDGTSSTWLATHAAETASTISLSKIIIQKNIALFLNPETFSDWRRTGFPTITPASGSIAIPRRFYYPQYEINANSYVSAVSNVQLTDRVWWDVH